MTLQTPSIVIPSPRRGPNRLLIGLAAAALAVAVGAGIWQAQRNDSAGETATAPAAGVERPAGARAAESAPTIYLVGSQAEAAKVQAFINEADAVRAHLGEPPLVEQVAVVAPENADAFLRIMGEQDAVRAGLGLPSVRVVDLRPAPAAQSDTRGGVAELIRDSGSPASLGIKSEAHSEPGTCHTTVGPDIC